jgi:histidine kinase
MKLLNTIQQRLGWKLFLSYLVIILVVVVVLDTTSEFRAATMIEQAFAQLPAPLRDDPALIAALHDNFQVAVNESLVIGSIAAILVAAFLSLFVVSRIVRPIQVMMQASRRIARGDYHHRIEIPGQDELSALAQHFNQMSETLERTEARRVEGIGDLAHELRTPLSSIKSMMEGLVDGMLSAEPATFLRVQREVARLQRLVHDLEELARIEAGQIGLNLHEVNINEVIQAAADRLQPQFDDKEVQLHLELPRTSLRGRLDIGRILQVLLNLMGNALQYTPSGGTVTVQVQRQDGEIVVTVYDTGIGIAGEDLPYLFERFYRVDRARTAGGGSGIGLTIARRLLEAHNGRIWATSPGSGLGSSFTFTLPSLD